MTIREDEAHEVASLYYLQGQTMETIARQRGISRSSVSRILGYAREIGLVRISVSAPPGSHGTLAGQFREAFGVETWVVPVRGVDTDLHRLQDVAQVAAEKLTELIEPGTTLGIAWGNTTSAITQNLPKLDIPDCTVVQLNGASNASDTGMPYAEEIISQTAASLGAKMVHFPVPAFFDYADTREAMWRERSVQHVLGSIKDCNVALFGVGAMNAKLPSHVYTAGFLDATELKNAVNDGVVGDVCTVLIREDGSTDMDLNRRASGPTPDQLRKIPRRLCVAAGDSKATALIAALRAGVATDLVIDSSLAQAVMRRLQLASLKRKSQQRR